MPSIGPMELIVVLVIALPYAFAELRAGKGPAGLLHQNLEHVELPRGKRDCFPGARYAPMAHIHVQVGNLQPICRNTGRAAPAKRFDPRHQLVHRKWFRQVIVRAGMQAFDPMLHLAACSEDQNTCRTLCLTQTREDRQPVQARQIQIKQHEVRWIFQDCLHAFESIVE